MACFLLLVACRQPVHRQIIGAWNLDSIYDNYNGFCFTNRQPHPREVYEYRKNNTVLRKGMGEQLEYQYWLTDSILSVGHTAGRPESNFIILHLDPTNMALKKNKKLLFEGKNQYRYEVLYFTRIDTSALK